MDSWENQVVQVLAEVTVGAESVEVAAGIAESIDIHVDHSKDRVEVKTILPDTRDLGRVAIEVNYAVTIPRDAGLVCENTLGDTVVRNVGGDLSAKTRFGIVDIREVGGIAHVWARGEFPLQAHRLRQGGVFVLSGTQAEFGEVGGKLQVSNYRGAVTIRDLLPEVELDVTSENGPIHLYLADGASPDLEASVLLGTIVSDVPLRRATLSAFTLARDGRPEATQRAMLHATFSEVVIHREGLKADEEATGPAETELVKRTVTADAPVGEGGEVVVDAVIGDVRVEGVDEDVLTVSASQLVRLRSNASTADAQSALDALELKIEEAGGRLRVRTSARDDLTAFGCAGYRVDLDIRCPRTSPLKLQVQNGHTSVESTGGSVTIEPGCRQRARRARQRAAGHHESQGGRGSCRLRGPGRSGCGLRHRHHSESVRPRNRKL